MTTMKSNTKENQGIDRKVSALKRLFTIGIILMIISFCCMTVLMYRLIQLQNELDDLDQALHEKPTSEVTTEYLNKHSQQIDEIDQELDIIWILLFIVMAFWFFGFTLFTIGYRYKRFLKLKEEIINQPETDTES
ncbi:MAG: hypothetical protein JSV56_08490 [Methanomassiliicoccales archaeon]|nr:MAG: hypothetical protein JSV56_08490 [Methanomassiliicoccales archaeon]